MATGINAYRQVLGAADARAFTFAGLAARLSMSMTGLGIVLLVSITTGSYSQAGLVAAVAIFVTAVCAPGWGRLIDRVGQASVLIAAAVIYNVGVAGVVAAIELTAPLWLILVAAVIVGLGFSSAGSCVRARWSHRYRGSALLDTAFAWEAVLDEVVFIVGPVLATFLATAVHPAAGLAAGAIVGLVGSLALAAQRRTEPPRQRSDARRPVGTLPVAKLLPVVLASGALGLIFGGMEVVIIAFAEDAGVLPYAGVIVMAWASGSLVSGFVTGTMTWRLSPAGRLKISAIALACSLLPLPFVHQPIPIAALLLLSGLAISPTIIASVALTQSIVPASRLTEALAWNTMGMAAGVGIGSAALGWVIDLGGATAGFYGVIAAGLVLIVAVLTVRATSGEDPLDTPTADRQPGATQSP